MSQKITKSQSIENLKDNDKVESCPTKKGRRVKYLTDEERINARRLQQKAYRARKKKELQELKEKIKETTEEPIEETKIEEN